MIKIYPEINAIIKRRRTIKPEEFNGEVVPEATIQRMLENADWAPTHGYTEPWRYVVYAEDGKQRLATEHADLYEKHIPQEKQKKNFREKLMNRAQLSSHILAVCMRRGNNPKIPAWEEMVATSCSAMNILLTASAFGVAAYWHSGGITNHSSIKDLLNLNEEDAFLGFIYLGYAENGLAPGRRVTPLEEKVNWVKS